MDGPYADVSVSASGSSAITSASSSATSAPFHRAGVEREVGRKYAFTSKDAHDKGESYLSCIRFSLRIPIPFSGESLLLCLSTARAPGNTPLSASREGSRRDAIVVEKLSKRDGLLLEQRLDAIEQPGRFQPTIEDGRCERGIETRILELDECI